MCAHADAVDTGMFEELSNFLSDGFGVGFDGPFLDLGGYVQVLEGLQELFPAGGVEEGRGSAADEDSLRLEVGVLGPPCYFLN